MITYGQAKGLAYLVGIPLYLSGAVHGTKLFCSYVAQGIDNAETMAIDAFKSTKKGLALDHARAEGLLVLDPASTRAQIKDIAETEGLTVLDTGIPLEELQDFIRKQAKIMGIQKSIALALFGHESDFKYDALSSASAIGIGQVMPANIKICGLKSASRLIEDKTNVVCALKILKEALDHAKGDLVLALAFYNWGETNTRRAGINNRDRWPEETKKHSRAVISRYKQLLITENEPNKYNV